jgi:hypothetical protein
MANALWSSSSPTSGTKTAVSSAALSDYCEPGTSCYSRACAKSLRTNASQPLTSGDAAVEVANAHLFEQSRRDAFNRLAAHDALMVDAEPEQLGVELVNRYQAAKSAGLI